MIYGLQATQKGLDIVASYDGSNVQLTLLDSVIIATAFSFSRFIDVYRAVNEHYPMTFKPESLVPRIRALEKRGLLEIKESVTPDTWVITAINSIYFKTRLADLFKLNNWSESVQEEIMADLFSYGKFTIPPSIEIEVTN